jgi:hypothetical protein
VRCLFVFEFFIIFWLGYAVYLYEYTAKTQFGLHLLSNLKFILIPLAVSMMTVVFKYAIEDYAAWYSTYLASAWLNLHFSRRIVKEIFSDAGPESTFTLRASTTDVPVSRRTSKCTSVAVTMDSSALTLQRIGPLKATLK